MQVKIKKDADGWALTVDGVPIITHETYGVVSDLEASLLHGPSHPPREADEIADAVRGK